MNSIVTVEDLLDAIRSVEKQIQSETGDVSTKFSETFTMKEIQPYLGRGVHGTFTLLDQMVQRGVIERAMIPRIDGWGSLTHRKGYRWIGDNNK